MKLDKQDKADLMQVYNTWWESYLNGNVEVYDAFLDDDFRFVGSTNNEEFLSRKDTTNFFRATADQLAGKAELRNTKRNIEVIEKGLVLVTDLADAYVLSETEWVYYSRFRFSSLLRKKKEGWRFIYQHFSEPDSKAQEGETLGLEQISKENQELRDAIKRRTVELENKSKELEIEAALERVRSVAMSMQKPDELLNVCQIISEQLEMLNVSNIRNTQVAIIDVTNKNYLNYQYFTPYSKQVFEVTAYEKNPASRTMVTELQKSANSFFIGDMQGKDLEEFREWRKKYDQFPDPVLDKSLAVYYYFYSIGNGGLGLTTYKAISDTDLDIFKRFHKVFELAYRRFHDIEKAEAQAREAQIEAALERVRARSMAMHKSEELADLSLELVKQVQNLGVETWFCAFNFYDESPEGSLEWGSNGQGTFPKYRTPREGIFLRYYEAGQRGEKLLINEIGKKECPAHYDYLCSLPDVGEQLLEMKDAGIPFPTSQIDHVAFFEYGYILFITFEPAPEAHDIFKRFAKVFEQTYTRFLDLQKAEAQAREAQIETALEKIRSRTMGMQKSEELKEVIQLVYEQFVSLNIHIEHTGFIMDYKARNDMHIWLADKHEIPTEVTFPYFDCAHWNSFNEAKSKGLNLFTNLLDYKEKNKFYQDLFEFIPGLPDEVKKYYLNCPGLAISTVLLDNVGLYIENFDGVPYSEEENNILMRFGKVFQQTYTRFNDLKQAEAQARESHIEAALERVRASTMAMHSSEELSNVAAVLLEQMKLLGGDLFAFGIVLCDKHDNMVEQWHSMGEGEMITPFLVPVDLDYIHQYRYDRWKAGESLFSIEIPEDYIAKHFDLMFELPTVKAGMKEMSAKGIEVKIPEWEIDYGASFSHGYLLVSSLKPFNEAYIFPRFAKVFEQAYTRFLDLQKAEAQAREAQIETALEKVRSRTMAMQKGEELKEVVVLLYKELMALGVTNFVTCGYVEINEKIDRQFTWVTNPGGDSLGLFYLPLTGDATFDERYAAWKQQQIIFHQKVAGEVRRKHLEYAITTFNSKEAEEMVLGQFPDPCVFYCFNFSHGYLHLVTGSKLKNEEELLLARFTGVFQQTYARFLDLQKAEAQARKAQVDAALDRTRSHSMQMQHSDEIKDLSKIFHEQLTSLNIPSEFSYIWLPEEEKDEHMFWATWSETKRGKTITSSKSVIYPLDKKEPYTAACFDAWESDIPVHVTKIPPEEVAQFFTTWKDLIKGAKNLKAKNFPEGIYYAESYMKYGCFGINIRRLFTKEEQNILLRFTIEFERAYTRFLDLKKAEEQAREAQIELALERIRSKVTAMQESIELLDIVVTMRTEFVALGHEAHYFWYMSYHPETYEKAMTSGDGTRIGMVMSLPRHIHGDIKLIADWEKSDEPTVVFAMDVETAVDYVNKMITLGDFKQVDPNAPTLDDIRHIGGLTFVMARTTHGEIGFSLPGTLPNPPQEDLDTLVRFAGVFDLAYRRFEDLKSAEHQHKEAQMELALERVRARALAMQQPEELKEVADVLRNEMGKLGIEEIETCSIYINDESAEKAECWYAIKDVRESEKTLVNDYFALNLKETCVGKKMLKFYQSQDQQVSIVMKGNPRIEWIRYCEERSVPLRGYYGDVIPDRIYHLYKFSHGAIGVATPDKISDENWGLLKRAASVFSLAYSRFKDLTQARVDLLRLKEEKKRAEDALTDLKATQEQLVHAEKMASLGELTAGIAHEIQNPLNFVNNFSEVNTELIEELKDELKSGKLEELIAIIDDIAGNEEKIKHHGKRAEAIVKGMLQHSRTTATEKELTDINELADEFLRLAYHGLRAKDKSFNADFKLELDEALPRINVIPADIGRVLLNLINNAFYAVSSKALATEDNYKPQVIVFTTKLNDQIEISVKDNGSGIPEKVKQKIFQPFFTTKPTGEGTGLGLSLSYDIVTKGHGGEMKVETKVGEGSEFIIQLPV